MKTKLMTKSVWGLKAWIREIKYYDNGIWKEPKDVSANQKLLLAFRGHTKEQEVCVFQKTTESQRELWEMLSAESDKNDWTITRHSLIQYEAL